MGDVDGQLSVHDRKRSLHLAGRGNGIIRAQGAASGNRDRYRIGSRAQIAYRAASRSSLPSPVHGPIGRGHGGTWAASAAKLGRCNQRAGIGFDPIYITIDQVSLQASRSIDRGLIVYLEQGATAPLPFQKGISHKIPRDETAARISVDAA